MIYIKKSLEHMAWSSQEIFTEISNLPTDIYGLRAADGEWPVGKILNHFVNAAEWFRYCLTGIKWSDLPRINNPETLLKMKSYLAELDQTLINQSELEDKILSFNDENGPAKASRTMILSQTVMHTAEHKGQLSTILKMHGYELDLDKYDVWSFESSNK